MSSTLIRAGWHAVLANMLGYSIDELTELDSWEAIVAPEDRDRIRTYCHSRSDGKPAPNQYEYQAMRKDGTLIWLENLSRAVTWDGRSVVQASVVDITKRKIADETMRNNERRAQEFASNVAHELKTPLGHLAIRLQQPDGTFDREDMLDDVAHMSRLIDQYLVLARLDRLDLDNGSKVDLRAVCVDVASQYGAVMVKEGKSIEVQGDNGQILVKGDVDCLTQVVKNLVENAKKHSGITGVVYLDVSPEGKINVIDHGQGIPFDSRERIFQRMQQGELDAGGTGLGLYIVKQIVEAHGGSVLVSDTKGGGATFTIDLSHQRLS